MGAQAKDRDEQKKRGTGMNGLMDGLTEGRTDAQIEFRTGRGQEIRTNKGTEVERTGRRI